MDDRTDEPFLSRSLARRLGALLYAASQAAQELGNRALAPLGLSVKHFGVLTFVRHESDGSQGRDEALPDRLAGSNRETAECALSQQAIGERLRIDRTTMVSLIDDLEQAGYVRRERNRLDRRAYVIRLTRAGERIQAKAETALNASGEEFFAPLSEAERAQLGDLLVRLSRAPHASPARERGRGDDEADESADG